MQAASEVLQKMHKYKKNRGKFTFSAIFLVFGLRRVAVASRWDCPLGNVGALEGTTMPLYVRTKSALSCELRRASVFPRISRIPTDNK